MGLADSAEVLLIENHLDGDLYGFRDELLSLFGKCATFVNFCGLSVALEDAVAPQLQDLQIESLLSIIKFCSDKGLAKPIVVHNNHCYKNRTALQSALSTLNIKQHFCRISYGPNKEVKPTEVRFTIEFTTKCGSTEISSVPHTEESEVDIGVVASREKKLSKKVYETYLLSSADFETVPNQCPQMNQPLGEQTQSLPLDELRDILEKAFIKAGADKETATTVTAGLLDAELEGYTSHGILRAAEYLEDIDRGTLSPRARPVCKRLAQSIGLLDGQRSFGAITAAAVGKHLCEIAKTCGIALVGLENSNHLGRLAEIGRFVSANGYVVAGFVNYLGTGQKCLPWDGSEPRFCTNPLLFGFPRSSHSPIIVDFTSTVVSEGKVRSYFLRSELVPKGWLVDENWRDVVDPSDFYSDPMRAFLRPLGQEFGHKGYALALAIEILAGILPNGGNIASPSSGGNGGLFFAFSPTVFGLSMKAYEVQLEKMLTYLKSCPPRPGTEGVRIPGEYSAARREDAVKKGVVNVPKVIWQTILNRANQGD